MAYIMVDDKNLKGIHGKAFEVLEETAEKFVINQNGTKSWIPKENARLLPDRFVPYETGGIVEKTHIIGIGGERETARPFMKPAFKESAKELMTKIGEVVTEIGGLAKATANVPKATYEDLKRVMKSMEIPTAIPPGIHPMYLEEWPNEPEECPVDPHNGFGVGYGTTGDDVSHAIDASEIKGGPIMFHPNDEMANLAELKKAEETIRYWENKANEYLKKYEQAMIENEGLRERSKRKGISNSQLNNHNGWLTKAMKEMERDMDGTIEDNNRLKEKINTITEEANERDADALKLYNQLQTVTADRDEYKRLNEYHREQVEIGNERSEKLKQTIESLHEQLNAKNKTIAGQATMIRAMEENDERNKRIIDALTRKTGF
jgi:hypothetical protein